MQTIKPICPSCGKHSGLLLVWGDKEYFTSEVLEKIARGEAVCGGDAISIDGQGRAMNRICKLCDEEWLATN